MPKPKRNTDQALFEELLTRNGIEFSARKHDEDKTQVVMELHHGHHKINTFLHCFCEFRFNADGSLAMIAFGY